MIPTEARTRPYVHPVPTYLTAYEKADELTIPPPPRPWRSEKPRLWWPWWVVGCLGLLAPGGVALALLVGR